MLKAGLGRITENTPRNVGVVILNMAGIPLGTSQQLRSSFGGGRRGREAVEEGVEEGGVVSMSSFRSSASRPAPNDMLTVTSHEFLSVSRQGLG